MNSAHTAMNSIISAQYEHLAASVTLALLLLMKWDNSNQYIMQGYETCNQHRYSIIMAQHGCQERITTKKHVVDAYLDGINR